MTETTTPAASTAVAANLGVKQGLPTLGLRQAEESAKKLWEAARTASTSKQVFAEQTGHASITSSSFKARLAVLKGLGIITVTSAEVKLSELGLDLVQDYDEEKRRTARIKAIHSLKAYRELVEAFAGTKLPSKSALTSRLKFEYGKTDEFAGQAADAFIESLAFAGMLDAINVVHKNGAMPQEEIADHPLVDEGTTEEEEAAAAELDEAFSEDASIDAEREITGGAESLNRIGQSVEQDGHSGSTSLGVTLDLSHFQANEVIRILQALGLAKRD